MVPEQGGWIKICFGSDASNVLQVDQQEPIRPRLRKRQSRIKGVEL